jgi:hypothetical protein
MEETKDSSQDTTVLGENLEETKVETESKETPGDEVKNHLSELVGEGKKYKTEEDLAKAYLNADNFIETLKGEKRELESEVGKAKTIEDVLKAINVSDQTQPESTPPLVPEPIPDETGGQPTPSVDINQAVAQVLAQQKKVDNENTNVKSAWDQLDTAFGDRDKAKVAVREYIDGDDNVKQVLDLLGKTNPNKLVEMVTATTKKSNVSFIDIDGNSNSNEESIIQNDKLTWDSLAALKKKDPQTYWSKKVQAMIHNAVDQGRLTVNLKK